jgi:hypothetical protein
VTDFFLGSDDRELICDLRKNNGKLESPRYEVFWKKLAQILDEKCVVNERRTTETCYMPDWISVRDLVEDVLRQCPEGTEEPSESWVRLNFHPSNEHVHTAINYKCRFNIKYAVQQRMLRASHPDKKYCALLYSYLKGLAVQWKDKAHFISVDEKAIIPVGQPHCPIGTNVRRLNRSLVTPSTPLLALDHDYHIAGIVPSIMLHIIIPENEQESCYKGKLYVKYQHAGRMLK